MEAWRTSVPVVPIIPVVLIAPVVPIVPIFPIAPVVPIVPVVVITPIVQIAPVVQIASVVLIVSNVSIVSMFQRTIDPLLVSDKVQGACGSQEAASVPPWQFFLSTPYGSMSAWVSQEAASWATRSSSVSQKPGLAVVGAAVSRQAAMWAQRFSWRVCMET